MNFSVIIKRIKRGSLYRSVKYLLQFRLNINTIKDTLAVHLGRKPTGGEVRWCFWDCLKFIALYNGDISVDYFGTSNYRKSHFVRKDSFATIKRFNWRDKINDPEYLDIINDKILFCQCFSEYLHRPWSAVEHGITEDELRGFCLKCNNRVFAKYPSDCGGKGVQYYDTSDENRFSELYKICQTERLILEGAIEQDEEIHSFSDSSVNTFRIVTIVSKSGTAHIAWAILRCGINGSKIDNFSSGGICAQIDIDTGIICSGGFSKYEKTYLFHPDTGKQIIGYRIDGWEEYKAFALELAMKYPSVHYVGWDIVKDSEGNLCVIEGNSDSGPGIEKNLLYGLMPLFNQLYENG